MLPTLDTTDRKLQLILGGAVTTDELHWAVKWTDVDQTTMEASNPASDHGLSAGGTEVDIMAAPASGVSREPRGLSVHNADTVAATVTIRLDDAATVRIIRTVTLAVGDSLYWSDGLGFVTVDSTGQRRVTFPSSIAVTQLAPGAARQVVQTNAGATAAEWTDSLALPGTLDVTGIATFASYVSGTTGNGYLRMRGDSTASSGGVWRLNNTGRMTVGVYPTAGTGPPTDEGLTLVAEDETKVPLELRSARLSVITGHWIGGFQVYGDDTTAGVQGVVARLVLLATNAWTSTSQARADWVFYGGTMASPAEIARLQYDGLLILPGNGTHVFDLPANATDPTGGGGAAAGRIPIRVGGATKYLAYY